MARPFQRNPFGGSPGRAPMTAARPMAGVAVARATGDEARQWARRHRRVLRQFRTLLAAVKDHFHRVDSRVGLGTVQAWALGVIDAQPGIRVAGLAAALDVCQPTASNVVRALCQRGLVERRRGIADRRTVCLFILDSGRSTLALSHGVFSGPLAAALSTLDAGTMAALEDDLHALLAHLQA